MISRRGFVRCGGAVLAGGAAFPMVGARHPSGTHAVLLYLRGGADGLSMLIPYRDPAYYAARPRTAVPAGKVIPLDGRLGLHPALSPLVPLWRAGRLSLVPAAGLLETPPDHAGARAVLQAALPRLGPLPPCTALGPALRRLALAINAGTAPPVARVTMGGWDTHVDQGAAYGRLAERLGELAAGLAGFAAALGPRLGDVALLTVTEFGRALRENANGGTDHGRAAAALVLGGRLEAGRVLGAWPGLAAVADGVPVAAPLGAITHAVPGLRAVLHG